MQQTVSGKKLVAPIVITAVIVAYYIGFIAACICIDAFPPLAKLLLGVIPLALAGVSIRMLMERIKEIRSGEEDDLGQY